jgi:hypothetical protein
MELVTYIYILYVCVCVLVMQVIYELNIFTYILNIML